MAASRRCAGRGLANAASPGFNNKLWLLLLDGSSAVSPGFRLDDGDGDNASGKRRSDRKREGLAP